MNKFDTDDAVMLSVLVLLTVAVSLPTGWRKGSRGAPFGRTLVSGFGRTLIAVFAVTALVGVAVSRYHFREMAENDLWDWEGGELFGHLHESEVHWEPACRCSGCRMAGLASDSEEVRDWQVDRAKSAGFCYPFLAPMFGLLALVPSVIATAVGYNIGARRRVERLLAGNGDPLPVSSG